MSDPGRVTKHAQYRHALLGGPFGHSPMGYPRPLPDSPVKALLRGPDGLVYRLGHTSIPVSPPVRGGLW